MEFAITAFCQADNSYPASSAWSLFCKRSFGSLGAIVGANLRRRLLIAVGLCGGHVFELRVRDVRAIRARPMERAALNVVGTNVLWLAGVAARAAVARGL
jgi:hypothetical protein